MKTEILKTVWETQVSFGIMLSVFSKFEILMDSNLLEFEILGVKENGLVNSVTMMKHGMIIKDSKID